MKEFLHKLWCGDITPGSDPTANHTENLETVRLAQKYLGRGVCGVDLAGYEEHYALLQRLLTAEGVGRAPVFFTLKNDGTAEKEYALKLTYPEGHYMNPKVLEELFPNVFEVCEKIEITSNANKIICKRSTCIF